MTREKRQPSSVGFSFTYTILLSLTSNNLRAPPRAESFCPSPSNFLPAASYRSRILAPSHSRERGGVVEPPTSLPNSLSPEIISQRMMVLVVFKIHSWILDAPSFPHIRRPPPYHWLLCTQLDLV